LYDFAYAKKQPPTENFTTINFFLFVEQYGYKSVLITACIMPLVELIFIACLVPAMIVTDNGSEAGGVFANLALLLHAGYGLLYVALVDRCFCRLIANPPPLASNMIAVGNSRGAGGARIIQPGVAPGSSITRNACPSCQVELEYTRQVGIATQVQCYSCQALVEFD
jgi:hypothetical protein